MWVTHEIITPYWDSLKARTCCIICKNIDNKILKKLPDTHMVVVLKTLKAPFLYSESNRCTIQLCLTKKIFLFFVLFLQQFHMIFQLNECASLHSFPKQLLSSHILVLVISSKYPLRGHSSITSSKRWVGGLAK